MALGRYLGCGVYLYLVRYSDKLLENAARNSRRSRKPSRGFAEKRRAAVTPALALESRIGAAPSGRSDVSAAVCYLRDSPVALSAMTASSVGAAIMKYQSTALASICTPRRRSKGRTRRICEQPEASSHGRKTRSMKATHLAKRALVRRRSSRSLRWLLWGRSLYAVGAACTSTTTVRPSSRISVDGDEPF